jgi:hypothetical protein
MTKSLGEGFDPVSIKIMGEVTNVQVVLELKSDGETKEIFNFLNQTKYKGTFKNTNKEVIEIDYCFDSSKLESENWACVVLRNLPPNVHPNAIFKNCSE